MGSKLCVCGRDAHDGPRPGPELTLLGQRAAAGLIKQSPLSAAKIQIMLNVLQTTSATIKTLAPTARHQRLPRQQEKLNWKSYLTVGTAMGAFYEAPETVTEGLVLINGIV